MTRESPRPTTLDETGAQGVRALADASAESDGVGPLGEDFLLRLGTDEGTHLVSPGAPPFAGYAGIAPDGAAELVVHPDERGHGLGTELARAVLDREPQARLWAHGDLPAAQALAAGLGLTRVRELLVLRRPLAGVPDAPPAPDGFALRTFRPGQDEDALLAINAAAFAHHPEQGRLDRAGLAQRTEQAWFDPAGLFLVEDASGDLAAFHWTKVADPASGIGEVYVVGVSPQHQGHGLGGYVTAVGLAHLAGLGLQGVELYVEGDNAPALATYARAGFGRHAVHSMYARATADALP
ncbi:mycothiol synthase [Janibacter melonis]|uniref:mycothiol synthase n=1 Tax=Janibacter melonis TaxID=262209 RepID=UPI0017859D1A|nr:mycothiol synthase [Janibacter melonis]